MSNHEKWTGEAARFLRERSPVGEVIVEFVTDEVVQVTVTFDVTDRLVDGGAWLLVHAVGLVASRIEEETGNPYQSFVTLFEAAWHMFRARKTRDQKKTTAER